MKTRRVPQEAEIIGRNLRDLRRRNGLTQKEIAFILGITFQQVQKYERGENRFPVEKLHLLKSHFGVPYEFFFQGFESETVDAPWPHNVLACLTRVKHPDQQNRIRRVVSILAE